MKKAFARRLALLLAVLMALPVFALQPAEVAFAAPGFNAQLFHETNALRHNPDGIIPIRIPGHVPGTFSFDLSVPNPGDRLYAIFPISDGRVIRLDFWRTAPMHWAEQMAHTFRVDHAFVLNLLYPDYPFYDLEVWSPLGQRGYIEAALNDYYALPEEVQALLTSEYARISGLFNQLNIMERDAFFYYPPRHAALTLTTATVTPDYIERITTTLAQFDTLAPAVQDLLDLYLSTDVVAHLQLLLGLANAMLQFRFDHDFVLGLDPNALTAWSLYRGQIEAALEAYYALPEDVQALLAADYAHIVTLFNTINELDVAAFMYDPPLLIRHRVLSILTTANVEPDDFDDIILVQIQFGTVAPAVRNLLNYRYDVEGHLERLLAMLEAFEIISEFRNDHAFVLNDLNLDDLTAWSPYREQIEAARDALLALIALRPEIETLLVDDYNRINALFNRINELDRDAFRNYPPRNMVLTMEPAAVTSADEAAILEVLAQFGTLAPAVQDLLRDEEARLRLLLSVARAYDSVALIRHNNADTLGLYHRITDIPAFTPEELTVARLSVMILIAFIENHPNEAVRILMAEDLMRLGVVLSLIEWYLAQGFAAFAPLEAAVPGLGADGAGNLHFMFTLHETIYNARNFNIMSETVTAGHLTGYSIAGLPAAGGTTDPFGFTTVTNTVGSPNDPIRVLSTDFPSVQLAQNMGLSFRLPQLPQFVDLAPTTFNVLWENNVVTFGMHTIDAVAGLLQPGRIHTFEFGSIQPDYDYLAFADFPVFYHLTTGINPGAVVSMPFSLDHPLNRAAGDADTLASRLPTAFWQNPMYRSDTELEWFGGFMRPFAAPMGWEHIHLYRDGNQVPWYINWADHQRVELTVPLPSAWDDIEGTFSRSLHGLYQNHWNNTGFMGDLGNSLSRAHDNRHLLDMNITFRLGPQYLSMPRVFSETRFGADGSTISVASGNLPSVEDARLLFPPTTPPSSVDFVAHNPADNTITIVLDHLYGSVIYDNAVVDILISQPDFFPPNVLTYVAPSPGGFTRGDVPNFATFAIYEWPGAYEEGYILHVQPFEFWSDRSAGVRRAVPGSYTIFTYTDVGALNSPDPGPPVTPAETVTVHHETDPIPLPIPALAGTDLAYRPTFHRIVFDPVVGPRIETRPFRLQPLEEHLRISTPRNFRIIDHELLPLYIDEYGNVAESVLNLQLSFDITNMRQLRSQMMRLVQDLDFRSDTVPASSLTIRYDLRRIGLDERYGTVDITIDFFRLTDGTEQFRLNGIALPPYPHPQIPYFNIIAVPGGLYYSIPEFAGRAPIPAIGGGFNEPVSPIAPGFDDFLIEPVTVTFWVQTRANLTGSGINHPFDYPNVHLLYVMTTPATPEPPPSRHINYDFVRPGMPSNTDMLVLHGFDRLLVMPPQNFVLVEEEYDEYGPDGSVTLFSAFTAPYSSLREFAEQMLTFLGDSAHIMSGDVPPRRLQPYLTIPTFTMFLSQNPEQIQNFAEEMAEFNRDANATTGRDNLTGIWANVRIFDSSQGLTPPPGQPRVDISELIDITGQITMRDALRQGYIVALMDFPASEYAMREGGAWSHPTTSLIGGGFRTYPAENMFYRLDGFDQNQRYYGAMMTMLSIHHPAHIPNPNMPLALGYDSRRFFSDLTGIVALTTAGEHMPIDPEEIAPNRPMWYHPADWEAYRREHIGDTFARLFFHVDEVMPGDDFVVRYEVIRSRTPIDPARLLEAMNDMTPDARAWAAYFGIDVNDAGFAEFYWIGRDGVEIRSDPEGAISVWPFDEHDYTVFDVGLFPNNIYFYYIRAVSMRDFGGYVGGEWVHDLIPVNFSVWDAISITTATVEAPRNLIVVRERGLVDDPSREVYIQFEVPRESAGFRWELEIREGDGEWVNFPKGILPFRFGYFDEDGRRFYIIRYRVRGLTPNTDYTFRVRLIDNDGFPSLWSNEAFHRTEFDQREYDIDRGTNNWIEFIRRNLWYTFDRDYWPLEHTAGRASLKLYRYSRVGGMVRSPHDSHIIIYANPLAVTDQRLDILLPVSLIETANRNNQSLIIRSGRLETVIPPNALTDRITGVNDARYVMDSRHSPAVDYYVMISIQYTNLSRNPVDGNDLGERQAHINATAMAAVMNARELDNAITQMVTYVITSDASFDDTRRTINSMLRQGLPNDEVAIFAYGVIERMTMDIMRDARQMYVNESYRSFPVTEFAVPLLHALLSENQADIISAFAAHAGGNFAPVSAIPYRLGMSVRINGPASILFTLFNAITGFEGLVENVTLPGDMATVIARYSLQDFVGRTSSELNSAVTLNSAMNIVARLAGASSGADGVAFMRERGYIITGRTASAQITRQEAAFLVVALYEMRSGRSVYAVAIRNHAATAGISGIDSTYLQSVRVAFELDLITEANWQPREVITMMELLDMLSRLNFRMAL